MAAAPEQVTWTVAEWCQAMKISRAKFYYGLAVRPRDVKVGRLRRICEAPADYLQRLRHTLQEDQQAALRSGAGEQ